MLYNDVKKTFIKYFIERDHVYKKEIGLIPISGGVIDETILFTNSGMVQFKDIFLGAETKLKLACNSQRCVRAGGKHNDLEDVGLDSYHHTYFEMLGSWSFNNETTPKAETIEYAWDLLVNVFGLKKDNIYVTYYESDDETKNIWLKYTSNVISFGAKENFWEMGITGPCGPCTEIHYDKIGNRDASNLVNKDDPDVIEIWNLVFMQNYRNQDGSLSVLKKKHIDTGMGLERLVAILQGTTNYQTDLFKYLLNIISDVTKSSEYKDLYGIDDTKYVSMSYRIIADHARTLIFAINDDIIPSATGRGYVLRKIVRRAIRFVYKLNPDDGLLTEIVKRYVEYFEKEYLELSMNKEKIIKIISEEEIKFSKVMKKGLKLFAKIKEKPDNLTIKLFKLYTTCGFPIDIIKQLCLEDDILFDKDGYEKLILEHAVASTGK